MPHFTLPLSHDGAIVQVIAAVSESRRQALQAAGQSVPLPVPFRALIDTGASCTCIDAQTIAPLQLSPTGQATMTTPSTGQQAAQVDQFDVLIAARAKTRTQFH